MQDSHRQLRKRIAAELARLAALGPMLKGTVNVVKRGPRKRGAGERTAYLLTYKGKANKTATVYVPAHRVQEARDLIARHCQAKATLTTIVDLSVRLFKAAD